MSRKAHAMPVRKGNMFAALSLYDSDSSTSEELSSPPSNPLGAPAAAAPSNPLGAAPEKQSPPFRVWKVDEDEKRFAVDNSSVFSSPFSRKKVSWSRPRFKNEDSDGWVSIQVGLPSPKAVAAAAESDASFCEAAAENYDDCPDYAPPTPPSVVEECESDTIPTLSLPPQEFPSLLGRGSSSSSLAATAEDQRSAMAWAEKIKNNLEKAEKARVDYRKNKEETSRFDSGLSFFRRGPNANVSSGNNSQ